MSSLAFTREGYKLLHEGAKELSVVESNGIRIDMDLLARTKDRLKTKIRDAKGEVESSYVFKNWRKRFGFKTNLSSRDQVRWLLYEELEIPKTKYTQSGKEATDDEVLQNITHKDPEVNKFIQNLAGYYRYEKTLGTFLKGIEWEVVDGRLHPIFDLHTARTMRSSSSMPNFQNFPVRNDEISKIIRSLFIASSRKHVLAENDFKGIEVGVSACYHKDPNFIRYIEDKSSDMHRDMAAQLYCFTEKEWKMLEAFDKANDKKGAKQARYGAKNKFVFPQFYGDWYIACAKNMWEWIEKGKLTGPSGEPLKEFMARKGIRKLGACDPDKEPQKGTFEAHVKATESDFWNRRFQQYGRWKKQFYNDYLEKGYFDILSGFRIFGAYSKNQVCNAPVQGAAFHCLLWSLIQINRQLRKYHMRSKVAGQIHDSLIGDIRVDELRDYLEICHDVTQVRLRKHFEWLEVPLEIEFEICPIGEPWSAKREYKFKDGKFKHPEKDAWTDDAWKFLRAMEKKPVVINDRPSAAAERGNFRSKHQVSSKLVHS